jgi:predicted nucleic acid-binding protein
MTPPSPLLLDACVVLSLYASRRMEEILGTSEGPFLVAEAVLHETLYVHVNVGGVREKEPVVLDPLLTAGILAVVEPESEDELLTYFDLALQLDDGEAMSGAIALHRGYRIATDDGKMIRLLGQRLPIVGTLDLVRAWVEAESMAPQPVREALIGIAERGYVPGRTHPHRHWWDQMFPGMA